MTPLARRSVAIAILFALLSACADHYDGRGVVLRVAEDRSRVTVSHEAIPGYMDAMVMPLAVDKPTLLEGVQAGDRIHFRLEVSSTRSLIDKLTIVSAARNDAGLLRSPVVPQLVAIGASMPDFTLHDQSGTTLSLSDLRGQVVLVNFIYARCPLPDYCPLLMRNFGAIKRQFSDQLGREVTLLTITFDPKYDTQEVLALYGQGFGADGPGWHLLTGTPEQIQRVTEGFGIEFWPDEGLITHTLQTAVIDRDGRLFAAIEGKDYSVRQLADVVNAALGKN